jgi:hypothetical protein
MTIEIGKLYSCLHYRRAIFDSEYRSSYLGELAENSLFVVLEVKKVSSRDIFCLKILTSNGIVGWIHIHPVNVKVENQC